MTPEGSRADVAVIGLGLIGCAATRHLAAAGMRVVGIGPGEPEVWATHPGPFSSHYDSGRITRRLDARLEWAILANRAIAEYSRIEAESMVEFHHPTGLVFVRNDDDGIANQLEVIRALDLPVMVGTVAETRLNERSPVGYHFPEGWTALIEPDPAGFIDPRSMVRAQIVASENSGAKIRREIASELRRGEGGGWRIQTASGEVAAERVVIATGPYLQDLHGRELQASVRPESVILGRIADAEADRLSALPAAIYLLDHPEIDDVYIVPPAKYPDGRCYIKMGGSNAAATVLSTASEKQAWMVGDAASRELPAMRGVLTTVLPRVNFESFEMKPCLITDTPSGLPYVDSIDDDLFVAVGGNGHAAKSADAIGALVADLVINHGKWTDADLESEQFAAQFGQWSPRSGSRHGS